MASERAGLGVALAENQFFCAHRQNAAEIAHKLQPRFGRPRLRGIAGCNQGPAMNKAELIEHIAEHADLSKACAARALEAVLGAVTTTLKNKDAVTLVGFGTFVVSQRAARAGRNPSTGVAIKIAQSNVPKFRPGKALKDALN